MNLTVSLISAIGLAAVISSEHIDAWAKLGATGLLGALLVGFGFLHWKVTLGLSKAHKESCEVIASEIRKQNDSNNEILKTLVDRLRD